MAVYIARYCVENVVDRDELTEVIEDLMDEEFETVCHDDSPRGKYLLLYTFLIFDSTIGAYFLQEANTMLICGYQYTICCEVELNL